VNTTKVVDRGNFVVRCELTIVEHSRYKSSNLENRTTELLRAFYNVEGETKGKHFLVT
jgi:hypothetical protein